MTPKALPRTIEKRVNVSQPPIKDRLTGNIIVPGSTGELGSSKSTLWISAGHPVNRKTGKHEGGGPFHVTHSGDFCSPGKVTNIVRPGNPNWIYTGPVFGNFVPISALGEKFDGNPTEEMDTTSMDSDGATAISLCAPTNPTASLSTTLAEVFREGIPSLPGIQSWKKRTELLKAAGSEYLNYQFGWAPLHSEVQNVVNAARNNREIMKNYRHNEGRNVHRRFDFASEKTDFSEEVSSQDPILGILSSQFLDPNSKSAQRVTHVSKIRRRWFEGCFTYGGPGRADNFSRAISFGNEADAVYGLNLNPDVLWELTPWSWAVDWFTNAGDVIHNISQFAMAGLVMRYGYMMEETISSYHTSWEGGRFMRLDDIRASKPKLIPERAGSGSRGKFIVTKSRVPANPFGFGIGWEGLSPTQLAITAAIGITRFL